MRTNVHAPTPRVGVVLPGVDKRDEGLLVFRKHLELDKEPKIIVQRQHVGRSDCGGRLCGAPGVSHTGEHTMFRRGKKGGGNSLAPVA